MQLRAALKQIQQSPEFPGLFVIALQGHDDPAAFLGGFYQRLKELLGELTCLDLEQSTLNDCKAHLDMSFLGMRKLYVLKNFTALDAASRKAWKTYLEAYRGPHGILFFESLGAAPRGRKAAPKKIVPLWSGEHQMVIELPEKVDREVYAELFSFFYPTIAFDKAFMQHAFLHQEMLTLDDAYRIMGYQVVVGRNGKEFFESWYAKLVISEASLFTLSQYLLQKNPRLFLRQWKACKDEFPQEFWIAYWSEQMWQAAQYVSIARSSGADEAKRGTYRLPFTFLNTDWRRYTPQALAAAHNGLYELDYSNKNGGGEYALDLWLHRFLKSA